MPESLMVLVDVAGFTRDERLLIHQMAVREGLYKVLEEAFTKARVDWSTCYCEDRGDGVMILVPPDVPAVVLADELPDRIVAALRDHNEVHALAASIQLRLVLHSGQVERDRAGVAGPALNFAFRLLAAPGPKTTLRTSGGLLAVIVSEPFYADVISQRPSAVPGAYLRFKADYNGFAGDAWLRVLGEPPPAPAEAPEVLGPFPAEEMDRVRAWLADVKELDLGDLARRSAPSALPLPRFVDAWHAFTRLADVNSGPDGVPPVLVFLDALATEVGGELGGAMIGWIDRQVRLMAVEEAFEERRAATARAMAGEQRLHLVISIEHDGIALGRYVLSAWRQDDPDVWAPVRSEVREVDADEIEQVVDDVVVAAERAWADQRVAVTLKRSCRGICSGCPCTPGARNAIPVSRSHSASTTSSGSGRSTGSRPGTGTGRGGNAGSRCTQTRHQHEYISRTRGTNVSMWHSATATPWRWSSTRHHSSPSARRSTTSRPASEWDCRFCSGVRASPPKNYTNW